MPYVWLQPREFRWEGIVEALIRPSGERAAEVQGLFSNLWKRFARDFADESFNDEYNGMKHGLRTGPGGFRFSLALEGSSGEPIFANESEHGSSFFARRAFVDEPYERDRPARPGDRLFRVRRHLLNWDPEGLCDALALISASIHDVRDWLLALNGADASALGFEVPPEEAFRGPLGLAGDASFSGIDLPVVNRDVEMLGAEEIRRHVATGMRELRDRPVRASQPRMPGRDRRRAAQLGGGFDLCALVEIEPHQDGECQPRDVPLAGEQRHPRPPPRRSSIWRSTSSSARPRAASSAARRW